MAVTSGAFGISRLENAHLVGEVILLEGDHAADTGGEVGGIGLKATGLQRFLEGLAVFHEVVNGIGLVAVGDDQLVLPYANGGINDQGGVFYLRRVEGVDDDLVGVGLFHEYAVAAVGTSAHDEVSGNGIASVCGLTDDHAATGVGVAGKQRTDVMSFVYVHLYSPIRVFFFGGGKNTCITNILYI